MNEFIFTLFGNIDQYSYNKNYVKYFLDKTNGQPVRMKVTSYGGSVGEAVAISNLLAEHGNVTIEFIGFNASSVTWMAFGAKQIEAHEDAMWLAHKASVGVNIYGSLNMDQLDAKITELQNAKKSAEAIDLMIAKKYADKCKKSVKNVISLMAESRWMPASEAAEWGFVDKIIPGINKRPEITDEITNCFNAMGLPLPVIAEETENKDTNIIDQIINGFKAIFNTKNNEESNINSVTNMRKEFHFVNQLLNCEGVEEKDGKINLSVESLKVINVALQAAKTANSAKETAENNLSDVINSLDALSDTVKNAVDGKAKVQVIKDIIDKIPGTTTVNHQEQDDDNKFADIATDPINNYENE